MLKQSTQAFSLLSLLITALLLISTSMWSYIAFKQSINRKAAYHYLLDLESAINLAAMEATIKHQNILICPIANNSWTLGFNVITQTQELLRTYNHQANAIITWRAFGQSANHIHNSIQILPNGTTINNGTFAYRAQNDYTKVYKLIINQACKVYIIEEDANATKL